VNLPDALRLIYIVDAMAAADVDRLDAVLGGGATALWLREPERPGVDLYRIARTLKARCRDHDAALLIGDRAHVTLAAGADGVQISHVPVIWPTGDRAVLRTHVAAANPQGKLADGAVADGAVVTVIFSGPHGYISPTWYETNPAVPTWNYTAVHVQGPVSVILDPEERRSTVRDLANRFEGVGEGAWDFDALPKGYRDGQMKGIIVLEIAIETLTGKFKLSQNRPPEDRKGVVRHLEQSNRPDDRTLAAFMRSRPGIVS